MRSVKMINVLIAICIIIILGILISYLLTIPKKEISSDDGITKYESESHYVSSGILEKILNRNKYFVIKDIVSTYISNVKEIKSNDTQTFNNNENYRIIYNMLDQEYLLDLGIKDYEDIEIPQYSNYDLKIEDIYIYDKNINTEIFIVYYKLGSQEHKIIVKMDLNNNTFSLFLEDYIEKYNYSYIMDVNDIKISNEQIQKNENNMFKYVNKYDKDIINEYYQKYLHDIKYDIQKAYESIDLEYSKLKFKTIDEYQKYIKENQDILYTKKILYKSTEMNDNIIEYYCKDEYGFNYIIKEISLNDYKIILDNYTLETKSFNTKYDNSNDVDKAILNADKFIQMINSKDYTSAYAVLDERFKANYFKTQQDFENYIKNKMYEYNEIEYNSYTNKIIDIYSFKTTLTDLTKNNLQEKEFNIIVKLLEDRKFIISFEV